MAAAPDAAAPLTAEDADRLLRPHLAFGERLLLAISGGVDSMVLLHLAADVAAVQRSATLLAISVDHGLRPEAAAEAAFVAEHARRLGITHDTRSWTGPKPATGIAAAARAARYDLLAAAARDHNASAVLTAHTLDDQAETVIMRLARGSGVDGLSAMSPIATLDTSHGPLRVLRPFLDVPKARLVATATTRGIPWCDDPSNENDAAERVRVRRALSDLNAVGVSSLALGRTARRLQSARTALEVMTARALADARLVHISPLGAASLDRQALQEVPGEIRVRLLAELIRHVGGQAGFLSRATLEDIDAAIAACETVTYAHTKVIAAGASVHIQREPGRPAAAIAIAPGETRVWDRRFRIERFADPTGNMAPWTINALGPIGLKILKERGNVPDGVRADLLYTVPGFWSGDALVSAPALRALGPTAEPADDFGRMTFIPRGDPIVRGDYAALDE